MAVCLFSLSLEALVPSPELKEAGGVWRGRQNLSLFKLLVKSPFFCSQTCLCSQGNWCLNKQGIITISHKIPNPLEADVTVTFKADQDQHVLSKYSESFAL